MKIKKFICKLSIFYGFIFMLMVIDATAADRLALHVGLFLLLAIPVGLDVLCRILLCPPVRRHRRALRLPALPAPRVLRAFSSVGSLDVRPVPPAA